MKKDKIVRSDKKGSKTMYKILRMVFAIIAAVLVAACIFVALYVSMLAFWCVIGGALLCFALSMFFKYLQEEKESCLLYTSPSPRD